MGIWAGIAELINMIWNMYHMKGGPDDNRVNAVEAFSGHYSSDRAMEKQGLQNKCNSKLSIGCDFSRMNIVASSIN